MPWSIYEYALLQMYHQSPYIDHQQYYEYIVIIKSYYLLYFCICVIDFKSLVRRNWIIVMCHEEDVRRDDFSAIIPDVKTGMANVAIKK